MADISLLGLPIEAGASEKGAIMGPQALRTAGLGDMLEALGHRVTDHGDLSRPVPIAPARLPASAKTCRNAGEVTAWVRAIHAAGLTLMRSGGIPVFLGGDHALSMGTVSAAAQVAAEAERELHVLWLDAHADFNTPSSSPSGNLHGMSLAFACGDPELAFITEAPIVAVPPERVHLFGLRSVDPRERLHLAQRGIDVVDMRMIDEHGVSVLMQRLIERIAGPRTHLHVSLDVDFLDPAIAPGVGTTVPGGATYREAHLIMEMLHDCGLTGSLDIVELNPFLDERGRSAHLLADLAASLFGRSIV